MILPDRIRATDLGEFLTDYIDAEVEDEILLCCSDPEGPNGAAVQPDSEAMDFMKELARCYNLVHAVAANLYVVINDGENRYPIAKSALAPTDTEEALKAMSGDEYSLWCSRTPWARDAAGGDIGSKECLAFCQQLIDAGVDYWKIA